MQVEAMVLRTHGGPEVLRRETIDLPEPGPREVRVRVRAVALNHLDIWTRRGLPHIKHEYPHRLGADIAGTIDALGPGARLSGTLKVGDKVLVSPGISCGVCAQCLSGHDNLCKSYKILGESTQGGYARFHNVPDANLLPFPEPLSFTDAAAIPLVFLTAWQMLVHKAKVRPGETVLVQAAGSGVSSAAIQIAKLFGARVIATTGSEAKMARARELGADHVINYAKDDFVAECKKHHRKARRRLRRRARRRRRLREERPRHGVGGAGRDVRRDRGLHPDDRSPPGLLPSGRDPRLDDGLEGGSLRGPRPRGADGTGQAPPCRRPRPPALGSS